MVQGDCGAEAGGAEAGQGAGGQQGCWDPVLLLCHLLEALSPTVYARDELHMPAVKAAQALLRPLSAGDQGGSKAGQPAGHANPGAAASAAAGADHGKLGRRKGARLGTHVCISQCRGHLPSLQHLRLPACLCQPAAPLLAAGLPQKMHTHQAQLKGVGLSVTVRMRWCYVGTDYCRSVCRLQAACRAGHPYTRRPACQLVSYVLESTSNPLVRLPAPISRRPPPARPQWVHPWPPPARRWRRWGWQLTPRRCSSKSCSSGGLAGPGRLLVASACGSAATG